MRPLLLLCLALCAACGRPAVTATEAVSVQIALDNDVCGVTSATATISASDLSNIGPVPLTVGANAITGTVPDVPVGRARVVFVQAFDASNKRVYFGTTAVDVMAGQLSQANVVLNRDVANCGTSPTGDVVIVGVLSNDPVDAGTGPGPGPTDAGTLPGGGLLLSGPGLAFTFDEVELADPVLYFLERSQNRIHRLSLATRALQPALQGNLPSQTMAIAPDGSAAYLAYQGGRIDAFDPSTGAGQFFAAAPATVSSMMVVGTQLFTVDDSGAWDTHSLFQRATGARVANMEWRDTIRSMVYSPMLEKVFYLDEGVSPTDVHSESIAGGMLGADVDSPYHGDYNLPNPLRLLPDETGVIVGSGLIFNTSNLTYRTSIGLTFVDIAFANTKLYLADQVGANAQVRVLDGTFSILSASYHPGTVKRLFVWQGNLVMVMAVTGGTQVRILPL